MNRLNTTSVSLAITPTVISTLLSHYLNRTPLKQRPTAHLSYDEGLHLIRSFLEFASHHTIEELQAFTSQWVPHPQWVKVEDVTVPDEHLVKAAELLESQLGPDGIRRVGGRKWWQWRKPETTLDAEWIEMRSDANERKKRGDQASRVMMYVHGGAYFFGSVDEHRYQMQRHARKLRARVFAPRYRLAPQFPFPCGLQDCVAAYLYLLTVHEPSQIVLAGDSAGGGMVLSLLCVLRDQGIHLPAGGILISPWVDLTHSFPSVGDPAPMDYIPQHGFHHKPSRGWPPPNEDDVLMMKREAAKKKRGQDTDAGDLKKLEEKQQDPVAPAGGQAPGAVGQSEAASDGKLTDSEAFLTVSMDGEDLKIKDQIQMYTTNELLNHPLVSPVLQASLGGLPPLLIMVGGGEILRDEQLYLAHKCANPAKYAPLADKMDERGREILSKYPPTDVQLQVWEDLCHVAPTLSFTRPAKYMYRSVAQFGAWCLARAQKKGIEILDDDVISFISISESGTDQMPEEHKETEKEGEKLAQEEEHKPGMIGKAGDSLPRFKNHMIRQRVSRHGVTYPLAAEEELKACCMKSEEIGVIKAGQVKKWLSAKQQWDRRYGTTKARVHKKIINDMAVGYHEVPGERPPSCALVSHRRVDIDGKEKTKKKVKSMGLALWSLWGSKHDEATVERELRATNAKEKPGSTAVRPSEGEGARPFSDIERQSPITTPDGRGRSRSRRRIVDENQTRDGPTDENTWISELISRRRQNASSPMHLEVPDTGATGKRPFVNGISVPFALNKEADTASMVTLNSAMSPPPSSRPMSPG